MTQEFHSVTVSNLGNRPVRVWVVRVAIRLAPSKTRTPLMPMIELVQHVVQAHTCSEHVVHLSSFVRARTIFFRLPSTSNCRGPVR